MGRWRYYPLPTNRKTKTTNLLIMKLENMENFKNKVTEGEIKLTPVKWLEELSNVLKKYKFKGDTSQEVLFKIDIFDALEYYELGYIPVEYVEENLLEDC